MKFDIITTREGFLSLEDDWKELEARSADKNFYLTYDWMYACLYYSSFAHDNLKFFTARDSKGLICVIPCEVKRIRFKTVTLRSLGLLGNIYSPYRNAIVSAGMESLVAESFICFLLEDYSRGWDVINFENTVPESPFLRAFSESLHARKVVDRLIVEFDNVIADLSQFTSSRDYFQTLSSKRRHMLRSNIKRLDKEGSFIVSVYSEAGHVLDNAIDDYYEVYRNSWKISERDPSFHRKLAHSMAKKGKLRLSILYFKKSAERPEQPKPEVSAMRVFPNRPAPLGYTPAAVIFMIVHDRTAYELKRAYREEFSRYSLGNTLFWHTFSHLIDSEHIDKIDFQRGRDDFKLIWGSPGDRRFCYRAANPRCFWGNLEYRVENHVVRMVSKHRPLRRLFRMFDSFRKAHK